MMKDYTDYVDINTHFYVSQKLYNWTRSLYNWVSIDNNTYRLFVHLLTTTAWNNKHETIFNKKYYRRPYYSGWIRDHIKACDWQKLVEAGLVITDGISQKATETTEGKCKLYWIDIDLATHFQNAIVKTKHNVNLFNGKFYKKAKDKFATSPKQTRLTKSNGKPITSALVNDAINVIRSEPVKLNKKALTKYYDKLDKLCKKHPDNKRNLHLSRLLNDTRAMCYMLSEGGYYTPSYNPSFTGRIVEKGKGLQGFAREVKRVAIKNMNYVNVDIKSAQLKALSYLLHRNNNDKVLVNLNLVGTQLFEYANINNIPRRMIKDALYGTIFSLSLKRDKGSKKLLEYLAKKGLNDDVFKYYETILTASKMLVNILEGQKIGKVWMNLASTKLTSYELEQKAIEKKAKKGGSIKHNKKKILMAFFLQAVEAYIIHMLTIHENEYHVISNQFDGLLIKGNVNKLFENMNHINKILDSEFEIDIKPICMYLCIKLVQN